VGVLDKGMLNWGKILPPEQVNAVTAYVVSLHGTNPPNPKAPQGDKVDTP
jgi:cytochrome c oxidase cbb3-type subunit 3